MKRLIPILVVIFFKTNVIVSQNTEPYTTQKAGFMVQFKDQLAPYKVLGVYIMPSEEIEFEVLFDENVDQFNVKISKGSLSQIGENEWTWKAPRSKGVYPVKIYNQAKTDSIQLNFMVMVPRSAMQGTRLNGYRIGSYANSGNPQYKIPAGFIEVTEENQNTRISPHFRLKDFLCKQAGSFPKYVVLQEKMLLKLEMMLEQVNQAGYDARKLTIMSGYRTPFYNKAIGNVKFSRHQYGDACDVFVDNNNDYEMDDLNNDGNSNVKDARILYRIVDGLKNETWYQSFIGGLGLYPKTSNHPAFIHVDTRGYLARWGH